MKHSPNFLTRTVNWALLFCFLCAAALGQDNGPPAFDVNVTNFPGAQPYLSNCVFSANNCSFDAVPEGKRLIVQFFSATFSLDAGVPPGPGVLTGGNQFIAFLKATEEPSFGPGDQYLISQPVFSIVEGGLVPGIFFSVFANSFSGAGILSGYLVDVSP